MKIKNYRATEIIQPFRRFAKNAASDFGDSLADMGTMEASEIYDVVYEATRVEDGDEPFSMTFSNPTLPFPPYKNPSDRDPNPSFSRNAYLFLFMAFLLGGYETLAKKAKTAHCKFDTWLALSHPSFHFSAAMSLIQGIITLALPFFPLYPCSPVQGWK